MKRLLLVLAIALAGGGLFARWLMSDPGYVLIIRDNWEIETSLGFALLVLLLLLAVTVVLTLVLAGLWNLLAPARVRRRLRGFVSRRRLQLGFVALVQGRHDRAERLMAAAAEHGEWPLAAWLGAARAAAEQGRIDTAQRYLENARECRDGRLPAGLEAARLAMAEGDLGDARQELEILGDRWPDQPDLLRMRMEVLEREQDWDALRDLLPRVKRRDGQMALRERRLWLALLQRAAERPGFNNAEKRREELQSLWRDMPAALQKDPALRARQAGYLAQLGEGKQALKLVVSGLEQGWDDRLPAVLDAITDVAPEKLLEHLEAWLKIRPGNTVLLLTAGRVSLRARLWGKARSFFEAAARNGKSPAARAELCRLLQALGEEEQARRCQSEQMEQSGRQLPELPLPERGETP